MTNIPQPNQSFTRLTVPDPQVNMAIQDIYNKLAQLQSLISQVIAKLP
jgi:hypothetical protein